MKHEVLIWQDSKDPDRYHVGCRYLAGNIQLWFSVYCDGLEEVFGRDILNYAKEGGEVIVEIETVIVPR